MKRLVIIVLSAGLSLGASAQHGHVGGHVSGGHVGGGFVYRPHVAVGIGYGFGYPAFGYPYYGYGWYGPWGYPYPPYYYGYGSAPSGLTYQIDGIKDDYKAQIKETRHDKALSHKEKRQKIDQLKTDRDQAIVQARKDYYNNARKNYYNRNNRNGNGNNGSGKNSNGNNGNENSGNENNGGSNNNNYNQ